jgi:hypothetical protein
MRVWRRAPTIIEIPAGFSHEQVLKTMELGTKDEAIENGWQRIAFERLQREPILAIDAKDLATVQEAFHWVVKETGVMPARVFHDAMMLEGKEVDMFYRYGKITNSDIAKWR